MCAFNFTEGREWGEGADSKLVLNRESIRVDLPSPVSPEIWGSRIKISREKLAEQ